MRSADTPFRYLLQVALIVLFIALVIMVLYLGEVIALMPYVACMSVLIGTLVCPVADVLSQLLTRNQRTADKEEAL